MANELTSTNNSQIDHSDFAEHVPRPSRMAEPDELVAAQLAQAAGMADISAAMQALELRLPDPKQVRKIGARQSSSDNRQLGATTMTG